MPPAKPHNKPEKKSNHENDKSPMMPSPGWRSIVVMVMIIIILVIAYSYTDTYNAKETTWLKFKISMLEPRDVERVEVINKEFVEVYIKKERLSDPEYQVVAKNVVGEGLNPGPHYYFMIGSVDAFERKMAEAQAGFPEEEWVEISYITRSGWGDRLLPWLFPLALILLFWLWMSRLRTSAGGTLGNPYSFGKSTAHLFDSSQENAITFENVAGLEEAKVEVKEIVDFLKNPETYTRLGAKIPKGVMFVGPPGTGKTLLARAVAGEAKVPFFSLSGSEFVEMFVGVGASRVRDLFKTAKQSAPSIIFIDEIDAIGRSRGRAQSFQTNDERESTLNQLLTEMDGFGTNSGVIVMAATNRADILDRALLRPGRFDRHIYLELPTLQERKAIFGVHLKPLKLAKGIQVDILAAQTPGFSGADIANICNEAALIAARRKKKAVDMQDFSEATDRIIAGLEKKSKIISPEEKKIIAYHEAGHATVSWLLKHVDALVKVSIVPRGKSLGAAWYLPQEHQIYTKAQFMDKICAALGGRAAEELIFGEVSSGALDDLEKVTKQAYTMIAYYGLDEKLGNISYYDSTGEYERFLHKPYSEATAYLIDQEVHQLVEHAYEKTKGVLLQHKPQLIQLATLLLEKEVVYQADLEQIFGKRFKSEGKQPESKDHKTIKEKIPSDLGKS